MKNDQALELCNRALTATEGLNMSDPERSYFEQEALARYATLDGRGLSHLTLQREAFAAGAQFGADVMRRRRAVSTDEAKLRDTFAMAALHICVKDMSQSYDDWAKQAFALADAMMAERAKGLADG